tara:strand:- start:265 stop:2079 length:1815 start_codon:yes stop_codon:yes gene_type:complete
MKIKSVFKYLDLFFIIILIVTFFIYRLDLISYGLPFFVNNDETSFQGSTLSSLSFITGYFELNYNPIYAPLINLTLILKSIFINELLINSLSLDQIRSKIYFNPELFLFYGRIASLTITSLSIFVLYLILRKLKINFLIYSILLITLSTSTVMLNVSTIMSKNSSYLLIYLIQLYFLIKYLIKINKFNYSSYYLFGLLASIAWGINYWSAFVSIYAVILLHYKKFKFSKIHFLSIFILVFIIFGPIINYFFVNQSPYDFISASHYAPFDLKSFIASFSKDFFKSFQIIYLNERNILLLSIIVPFFFLNKSANFKKELIIISFLIFLPIFLFGISDKVMPQLRYFSGINCVILILTAIVLNDLYRLNFKYLSMFLLAFNFYFIYENIKQNDKINDVISKDHSFYSFNDNIKKDKSKILYLVNLNFQESLNQNFYYLKLYNNNLINESTSTKKFLNNIKRKIQKIENTEDIEINNKDLKEDLIYFNYSYFTIKDLKKFFEFIKQDFEYIVIEESRPFYTENREIQFEIKSYVKKNFLLDHIHFKNDKIYLRSQQSVIHYFTNSLMRLEFAENFYNVPYDNFSGFDKINNNNLDVIYGANYSLYKLK